MQAFLAFLLAGLRSWNGMHMQSMFSIIKAIQTSSSYYIFILFSLLLLVILP